MVKELYPDAGDKALAKVLGIREYMPEPEKKVLPYPGKLDRLFISRLEHAGDDDYDER